MLTDLEHLVLKSEKLIVATMGAKVSVAFFNNTIYNQQAIEIDEIVDTTGCGMYFKLRLLFEWFKSKDIKKALRIGFLTAIKRLSLVCW